MNDAELHELIALLAVDALTGSEREEAELMVEQRPELRRELDELRAALGSLAEIQRHEPPAGLRAAVLAEVERTPQAARSADVVPIPARRLRRPWLLAAAAALVVVLAGAALLAGPFADDDQEDLIAEVLEADDAVRIPMSGELEGLEIVHSPDAGAAVLTGSGLPVPEGDRVYELWAIRDAPARVEIFRPDEGGDVEVLLDDLDPASADVWAITEEPAGGSDAPTSDVIAATA